jgi:betaine-aldehyde dehydrogenase
VGASLDDGVQIGPIVSQPQYEKVTGFIERAKQDSKCKLLLGGGRPASAPAGGFFVEPTIFEVTDTTAEIWNQEIFGPVLAIKRFDTEEEAIQIANNTPFGLAGGVMSLDEARCDRISRALDVGIAWINNSNACFRTAPWGGTKESGLSGRNLGTWGYDSFTYPRQITKLRDPNQVLTLFP